MNYDVAADKFSIGAAQGASGGGMGMLLGGVNGLLQGVNDEQAMKDQYFQQMKLNNMSQMFNKDMYNFQMGKQLEFWNKTNYAAQVEQLKKAGLNPALLYGKGGGMGASTGSASAGSMQSHAGSDTDRMQLGLQRQSQAMQMSLLASQKANIDADTKVKEAQAEKTSGVDTENVIANTNQVNTNIKLIESNTRNTDLRNEGQLVTNELFKLQKLYEEGTLDDRILNQSLQNKNLLTNINKIEAEIPWIGKIAQAQVNKLQSDVNKNKSEIDLNKKKGRLFDTQSDEAVSRIQLNEAQIKKIVTETGVTEEELYNFQRFGIMPKSVLGSGLTVIKGWFDIIEHAIMSDENKEGWHKNKK